MAFAALLETAGLKLMKNFPFRFFDLRGRNPWPRKSNFSFGLHLTLRLKAGLTVVMDHRPSETSLVSVPTVAAFRSPYAVESIGVAFQILPLFRGLHQ